MKKVMMATVLALGIASFAGSASARDHDHGWNQQWHHDRAYPHDHVRIENRYYGHPHGYYYEPAPVVVEPAYVAPAYYPPQTDMFLNFRL